MRRIDINSEKFQGAFYADLNLIKKLIKSKNDLEIKIPVSKDNEWLWGSKSISISVLDILNWLAFSLYEYYNKNKICHRNFNAKGEQTLNDCINPSVIYHNAIDCINWICNEFSIVNYNLKDYSEFRVLRHIFFDDDGWLDDDEIKEALKLGYLQIDLELINESEKGNGKSVYSLVKQGANYKIDPVDYSDVSAIVSILDPDLCYHTLLLISYLCKLEKYSFSESYDMLSSLYQVGVSNYILDIVISNE